MYCIHCGKELPDMAKFCNRCGKAVEHTDSTYSYAYKKAKTPPDSSGTYSYKKGDMPAGSTSDTEDGTYRHVYKKPITDPPKKDPPKKDPPKADPPKTPPTSGANPTGTTTPPAGTGTKPASPPKAATTPASSQSGNGCSGCLAELFILVCLVCLFFFVLKPMAQKNGWFGMTEPTEPTVVEEVKETEPTKSSEELRLERLAARLPGIREEHMDLPIFKNRLAGSCNTLEGFIGVTVLFVNDGESSWTQDKVDAFLYAVHLACGELTSEAAAWGKDLSFSVQTSYGTVTDSIVPSIAHYNINQIASSAGYSSDQGEFLEQLRAQTHTESVPVIVAFNKPARSHASPVVGDYTQVEVCYIFDDPDAVKHELLHLFGAADFYYHDSMKWAAEQYLGESIMASDAGPVDEMTAYLVGWTDTLTENANLFVYSVAAVGNEELQDSKKENTKTGYGTVTYDDGSVYTGTLTMGFPDGTGEIVWPNGDRYNGEWVHSQRTGYGTFSWANGSVYVGQFQDGNMHGQGTMTYYNGQVRSGYWQNNQFIG